MALHKKRSSRGSLKWFEEAWALYLAEADLEAGPTLQEVEKKKRGRAVLSKELARLSYENQKLRDRCEALEDAFEKQEERFYTNMHAFAAAVNNLIYSKMVHAARANDGMVKIESVPHLRECAKVLVPSSKLCTCGSQPTRQKPN